MSSISQSLRLGNIQALRGLAVLAVVLSHLMSVERKYAGDRILSDAFSIGLSGVDLFFAISGFVMVYVTLQNPGGVRFSLSFLFARISRIYPLYWLVSLAVLMVWLVRPDFVFVSNVQVSLLRSFALWPSESQPLLAVGWTLIHEMYFYLVFTLLVLLKPRYRLWAMCAWGIVVFGGFSAGVGAQGPVLKMLFHPLSFEFMGGALAALAFNRFHGQYWKAALFFGVTAFAIACLFSLQSGFGFWQSWPRVAAFAPAVSLIVYGAVGAERAGKISHQCLIWLGNQSYALYLSHVLTLSAAGRIWALFAADGILDNMLMLPLLLAVALFSAQMLHRFIEKPLLRYTKHMRRSLF